jgi:uncharacterized protein (DUF2141 family)
MILFISLLSMLFGAFSTDEQIYIELTVENVQTTEGNMLVSLYTEPDGFPYDPKTYHMLPKDRLKDGVLVLRVQVDHAGDYALSVVDDTNANGDMDKNFVGVPKEGFAFSNNATPRGLRPPQFNDAKFNVGKDGAQQRVTLKYY